MKKYFYLVIGLVAGLSLVGYAFAAIYNPSASTGISGSGTANYIPQFTSATTVGNSTIAYFDPTDFAGGTPGDVPLRAYLNTNPFNSPFLWKDALGYAQGIIGGVTLPVLLSSGSLFGFESSASGKKHVLSFPVSTANNGSTYTFPDFPSSVVAYDISTTTNAIGGSALTAGQCSSATTTATGATTNMTVSVTPATTTDLGGLIFWKGWVSNADEVTVSVCATGSVTPTSTAYNVRVIK